MSQDYEPPRASIGAKNMRDEETRPLITTQVFGSGTMLPKYAYDQTKKKYTYIYIYVCLFVFSTERLRPL